MARISNNASASAAATGGGELAETAGFLVHGRLPSGVGARHKRQRRRIHAVAQTRGLRTVVEHVAEMRVAARARDRVRTIMKLVSGASRTFSLEMGCQKLGQPVCEFELGARIVSAVSQQMQR